jgi:hypothetical protein
MTSSEFLGLVERVRSRGQGKWSACCPAHPDRNPSLSVTEGDKGLLVRCWSGCTVESICSAVGLRLTDLFFDAGVKDDAWRVRKRERDRAREEKAVQQQADGIAIDCLREAGSLVTSARDIDISEWKADALDAALDLVAEAHTKLEAERLEAYVTGQV